MAKKFYGIDMRGKYLMERLSTTPAWQSGDEGRLIYAEDSQEMKFGNSIDWSNAGSYNDVPLNTILLIESDVALTPSYTLLTNKDDMVVYITNGTTGEQGGTDKSGGTWTQPNHTHTGPSHDHSVGSHVHSTSGMTLTITQMPSHTHGISPDDCSGGGGDLESGAGALAFSLPTGGSGSHTHGNTGGGVGNTGVGGTGATGSSGADMTGGNASANTWRPKGRNFTRQQRI